MVMGRSLTMGVIIQPGSAPRQRCLACGSTPGALGGVKAVVNGRPFCFQTPSVAIDRSGTWWTGEDFGDLAEYLRELGVEGYEIHDGIRYDWKAGDAVVVHNNCVHQHFNASGSKPARALVMKTKPMFLFMNMLFQKTVEPRPTTPAPGAEGFTAREEEQDFNHDEE